MKYMEWLLVILLAIVIVVPVTYFHLRKRRLFVSTRSSLSDCQFLEEFTDLEKFHPMILRIRNEIADVLKIDKELIHPNEPYHYLQGLGFGFQSSTDSDDLFDATQFAIRDYFEENGASPIKAANSTNKMEEARWEFWKKKSPSFEDFIRYYLNKIDGISTDDGATGNAGRIDTA
jgi:hypothetical protein